MKINNERLKCYRKQARLTQEQVANGIGIPKITYQSYEQGIRSPKADTLNGIAGFLGVSVDCLLDCDEDMIREAFTSLRKCVSTLKCVIKSEDVTKMTIEEITEKLKTMK